MNILFCGDENVRQGIFLSTLSLCRNTSSMLNIYILTASIGAHKAIQQDFAENLQHAVTDYNKDSRVILLDISDSFKAYLPLANMSTRFTPLCMLRLFADTLPEIPDKILYLDTDVLCRKDFSLFYAADISGAEMAGVADRYGKWFFGNIFRHNYLNSGVLLLNMKKIRQSGLFFKCRDMCRDKRMFMPDQTALNKLAVKVKMNAKYNEQGKIKKDTVFKHFTTFFRFFPVFSAVTIKPWDTARLHNELKIFEFDDLFDEYKRRNSNEQRNPDFFHN